MDERGVAALCHSSTPRLINMNEPLSVLQRCLGVHGAVQKHLGGGGRGHRAPTCQDIGMDVCEEDGPFVALAPKRCETMRGQRRRVQRS